MNVLLTIILAVQMLSALGMIGLVLIQHGKGADMGAAFGGGGGSGSLFGASGSANFMSRATAVLASIFFITTLALAYFGGPRVEAGSGSVLMGAKLPVNPASSAASGAAAQIPGNVSGAVAPASASSAPLPAGTASSVVPAVGGASGAAAIPSK